MDFSSNNTLAKLVQIVKAAFWPKSDVVNIGIDNTPTANSDNLVKSGGVKTYVDNAIPSVPTISTNIAADKANNAKTTTPKAVYDFVCPPKESSQPVDGMAPGIFYDLGTLTGSVTLSLAAASDDTILNEWRFMFKTGVTVPSISWPNSISYIQGNMDLDTNNMPVLSADTLYEVSIEEDVMIITEYLSISNV